MWCAALILSHTAEACSVAFGPVVRAEQISHHRLVFPSAAALVCCLIGMLHGVQHITLRLRVGTGILFNLIFCIWMYPALEHNPTSIHPAARLASGEVRPDWLWLCIGCSLGFTSGLLLVMALMHWLFKPAWIRRRRVIGFSSGKPGGAPFAM